MTAPLNHLAKALNVTQASDVPILNCGLQLAVRCGDLSRQSDVDALLVKVNPWFIPIGHSSQAVHLAAGKQLAAVLSQQAPIASDQQLTQTRAFGLPHKALFHCLPPLPWRHPMYVEDLTARYREILAAIEAAALESLAMEPLGGATGVGNVWNEASLVIESICSTNHEWTHLKRLCFVVERENDAQRFRAELLAAQVECAVRASQGAAK